MVYCTLQEAWGNTYSKPKKKRSNSKNNNNNIEHFISTNDKLSKNRYRYDFSRDEQPLPQHNGNTERIKIEENYDLSPDEENIQEVQEEVLEELEETIHNKANIEPDYEDYNNSIVQKINELIEKIDNNQGNSLNDIILFILLGIFIIFILDTFVRIGKLSKH